MSNGTSIDATVILNDEIKMLDQLIAMIEAFAKDYKPGSAADDDFNFRNLACWAKELKGYRDTDQQYAGMSKPDLRSALQEEIDVLQKLHDVTLRARALPPNIGKPISMKIYTIQRELLSG